MTKQPEGVTWIEVNEKVDGPFMFEAEVGNWTALVLIPNGSDMWHVQAWNRVNPLALSLDTHSSGWAGFSTADDAMKYAEVAIDEMIEP